MTDPLINPTDLVTASRREGDAVILKLRGEVDLHNSPDLRGSLLEVLHKGTIKKLILNLTDVPYMDSSGIAVLVEALSHVRRAGGKIYLTNIQPRVKSILEIARLQTIFSVVADEPAALKK